MDDVAIRELAGEPSEMGDLQRVLEGAPAYAQLVTGAPPGQADAQSQSSILPDDKTYEDKFVFGFYRGSEMAACADLIRAYPEPDTAPVHRSQLGIVRPGAPVLAQA